MFKQPQSIQTIIDTKKTEELSPYVFGHNLEHTRACLFGGLSAQMLRNRKFAGKPSKNEGCPAEWFAIGSEHAFYLLGDGNWNTEDPWNGKAYTRHLKANRMVRRNEIQSLDLQNLAQGECGIGQNELTIKANATYELRIAALAPKPVELKVSLTDRDNTAVYTQTVLKIDSDQWTVYSFEMTAPEDDDHATLRCTFAETGRVVFGALSMMESGHFHGMRPDVVQNLKKLGVGILRWPGGNFAGEYRWQDMFLPVDERAPLEACTEIETQPYTHGYDFHEIDTDDFIALCREIGAEPFLTINLAWEDPKESAAWVEYCNGSVDTPYGRKRAERGHAEPYNVRFWSLGNEMGYGHMEGPMSPENYASLARLHAEAMLAVTPDLKLFSSGPYPNGEWAEKSAHALRDIVNYVSLHEYSNTQLSFHTPELVRSTYERIVDSVGSVEARIKQMRECIGDGLRISFDEWNYWYAWYRPISVAEGMFAAGILHLLMTQSGPMDMPVCCYFQPVGEGAIEITPKESHLTAIGQVFDFLKAHKGGRLCQPDREASPNVVATVKDNIVTVSMYNMSYDEQLSFKLIVSGELTESVMLTSASVLPHVRFDEEEVPVTRDGDAVKLTLPAHSIARLTFRCKD